MRPATRRALGLVAVGLVVAVVCTALGRWQWNRHVARDAAIAVVEANWAAAPVDLAQVVADPDAPLPDADAWRTVTVTGRWLTDASVLLRNRPVDSTPAYHVLVPLLVTDPGGQPGAAGDRVLVVDRGWVPTGADGSVDVDVPPPPTGEVRVTVRLRPGERPATREAPAGQVHAIDPVQVVAAGGDAVPAGTLPYAAYGSFVAETPPAAVPLGALDPPSTDPGSHLSYAFQWWVFALGGLVAFVVAARRELTAPDVPAPGDPGPTGAPVPAQPVRRARRRGRDEIDEDALVDAQLADGPGAPLTPGR
ncbi:SURF1 family protein [Cellulomonas oligotrophica]|uniref:SURF1-like protein n=1 Tax=Cellulomonas oligotrophica TaxID=931536 RepID=A0A7Y9FC00_9CELL|nr:SURF1 family protein [Cellulomonas oligotrophica]NYD84536.1 cytochrome oxidase assembly protein ShyY1 [Cellulomonas oligotrophica]GIG31601.1 hypothetical protein Col01nite_07600 [Cellulomonas oligotrophica]